MPTEDNNTYSTSEALEKARVAEAEGDLEEAASYYEKIIRGKAPEELPFDRLMIIYRKLKRYKDELKVINKGIQVFEDFYKKPLGRKSEKQQKLTTLSDAFMKNAGLKDKKGNLVYVPEPIARWMKRKAIVEKKLT